MLSRRDLIAGAAALAVSCGRRKASGYSGFAFVANEEGQAIAAVDLAVFAVARHIALDARPTAVVAHPKKPLAYALARQPGRIYEIQGEKLWVTRRLNLPQSALSVLISDDGANLYVLCREPRRVAVISTRSLTITREYALASDPAEFSVSSDDRWIAVSHVSEPVISLIDTQSARPADVIATQGQIGAVRFRGDSKCLIAADLTRRMLSLYEPVSRRPVVDLPLAVRPDHLCFNADRGQLFVAGDGLDGIVVVFPYYTPQVAETVLAGHSPGAMAASADPAYLFVAGPNSSDVSILDIETRRLIAVTPVGSNPNCIVVTPDSAYALVLNQTSGDMAVIRTESISRAVAQSRRNRRGALFMMIPVGSKPVSAAVVSI
ncbi:MAG TPA: hypothetical protein VKU01_19470 [Bryobacteraceae bacterium]|nr:hypothetical protein [Bryobacteraceae bacterium]